MTRKVDKQMHNCSELWCTKNRCVSWWKVLLIAQPVMTHWNRVLENFNVKFQKRTLIDDGEPKVNTTKNRCGCFKVSWWWLYAFMNAKQWRTGILWMVCWSMGLTDIFISILELRWSVRFFFIIVLKFYYEAWCWFSLFEVCCCVYSE